MRNVILSVVEGQNTNFKPYNDTKNRSNYQILSYIILTAYSPYNQLIINNFNKTVNKSFNMCS